MVSALGAAAVLATTIGVSAQDNRGDRDNQDNRQQQQMTREQQRRYNRIRKQHPEVVNQAGSSWDSNGNYHDSLGNVYDANGRVISSSGNRDVRAVRNSNDNDYPQFRNGARYRIMRNGSTAYTTDYRGAELLRQAINNGYQQGYQQGVLDRQRRHRYDYNRNSMYRRGNYGYQSYVPTTQYQYYFQQGFQRGYEDGFNSTTRYGYVQNGTYNILGSILGTILNVTEQ